MDIMHIRNGSLYHICVMLEHVNEPFTEDVLTWENMTYMLWCYVQIFKSIQHAGSVDGPRRTIVHNILLNIVEQLSLH